MKKTNGIAGSLVIMPMGLPWEWTTDYYEQSARILSQKAIVICVDLASPVQLLTLLKTGRGVKKIISINERLCILRPVDILPFKRFRYIRILNTMINVCACVLYVVWKYPSVFRKKLVLWICDPKFYYFPLLLGCVSTVLYDIVDYNRGIQSTEVEKKQVLSMDRYLTRASDVVTVNSKTLYTIYKKERNDVLLVPQGFRLTHFNKIHAIPYPVHNPAKKRIIGYVGGLNYRLDYPLLFALAKKFPNHLFVFVGKIQLDVDEEIRQRITQSINTLQSFSNVQLITDATKEQIPSLIKTFDIGIIPYDSKLPFNIHSFPMKLFEYFYMGKPIISSEIYEMEYYTEFVHVAKSTHEWMRSISNLLSVPWPAHKKTNQRRIAISHSWESKLLKICQKIEKSATVSLDV